MAPDPKPWMARPAMTTFISLATPATAMPAANSTTPTASAPRTASFAPSRDRDGDISSSEGAECPAVEIEPTSHQQRRKTVGDPAMPSNAARDESVNPIVGGDSRARRLPAPRSLVRRPQHIGARAGVSLPKRAALSCASCVSVAHQAILMAAARTVIAVADGAIAELAIDQQCRRPLWRTDRHL